uniref:Uncharacterized protein n=1 Tax=Chromera velia CCMP2878 TaxID=1169474 RepID=A0A0G4HFB8_9ALVE|eukprot:Cvel_983.t1-p1 / transcript=Cvel_983.t1 / gene=Cvel_983 / organism=Chromera_velia_CCMP2878 / gene_product=hypothetical protein / transcript_product=hypothetical protein / location=Cvel_scaffold32:1243-4794(-) / protein_length=694 / sequence_SO=supercontig / SO=protein_coding / is_pseudo=false
MALVCVFLPHGKELQPEQPCEQVARVWQFPGDSFNSDPTKDKALHITEGGMYDTDESRCAFEHQSSFGRHIGKALLIAWCKARAREGSYQLQTLRTLETQLSKNHLAEWKMLQMCEELIFAHVPGGVEVRRPSVCLGGLGRAEVPSLPYDIEIRLPAYPNIPWQRIQLKSAKWKTKGSLGHIDVTKQRARKPLPYAEADFDALLVGPPQNYDGVLANKKFRFQFLPSDPEERWRFFYFIPTADLVKNDVVFSDSKKTKGVKSIKLNFLVDPSMRPGFRPQRLFKWRLDTTSGQFMGNRFAQDFCGVYSSNKLERGRKEGNPDRRSTVGRTLDPNMCIRPNDSPHPDPVCVVRLPSDSPSEYPDTSVGSPHQAQQQQPQQSSDIQCSSDQPPSPKFDITDFGKDELILWRDENTGRCFLGGVRAVDPEGEGRVEVQAWGSNGKQPLASRRMQPAWCPLRGRPKLLYGAQKPSGYGPELCFLVPEEVVERNIVFSTEGTLPSHLCDTYRSVLLASPETVFPTDRLSFDSLASSAAGAAIFPPPSHPTLVAGTSVVYLWNEDTEVGPTAFQAATTHIPLPRQGLTVEQLDGQAKFRATELQSLADNDTYKRVPITEVDAEHRRSAVPTHFVDTEKHVEEGSWKYKSRVVADGTPFFDRCEGVTTSCATASQFAMRIALTIVMSYFEGERDNSSFKGA